VPIIRNPATTNADSEAVFYFPGCGSERLFSQVGLATQAMLWHAGVQTVLPPGYLCCGYPQRGSGDDDKAEKIITDNRVLFHRVANTLNYLDIKTVVVSCGTCYDQLQGYEFEQIFPGCRIVDIHEEEELRKDEAALRTMIGGDAAAKGNLKILTSCPSCLQGLQRYRGDLANGLLEADYIVVEMASRILGEDWMADYVARANEGGIERVLV